MPLRRGRDDVKLPLAYASQKIDDVTVRKVIQLAGQRTLYVIAPDYLASTFAFYARDASVTFHGFVRWEPPEVLGIAGYAGDWSKSSVVGDTLSSIAREGHCFECLDIVADQHARNQGEVHYGRVSQLLNRLEER
jgi:hypothetical protein